MRAAVAALLVVLAGCASPSERCEGLGVMPGEPGWAPCVQAEGERMENSLWNAARVIQQGGATLYAPVGVPAYGGPLVPGVGAW